MRDDTTKIVGTRRTILRRLGKLERNNKVDMINTINKSLFVFGARPFLILPPRITKTIPMIELTRYRAAVSRNNVPDVTMRIKIIPLPIAASKPNNSIVCPEFLRYFTYCWFDSINFDINDLLSYGGRF